MLSFVLEISPFDDETCVVVVGKMEIAENEEGDNCEWNMLLVTLYSDSIILLFVLCVMAQGQIQRLCGIDGHKNESMLTLGSLGVCF